MKKLVLTFAVLSTPFLVNSLNAQTTTSKGATPKAAIAPIPVAVSGVDSTKNGYLSLQQSVTGADVLPSPATGVDTLEYAAGALSLVHNLGSPLPLATTASTVASALSLAAIPTPCPVGQAVSAMDAKGNAVICVLIPTNTGGPTVSPNSTGSLYTYNQPSIQGGDTISNGSKSFASQATLPANVLSVGSVIDLEASGTYDITSSREPTFGDLWVVIGGNKVAASNFESKLAVGKNYIWTAHFRGIVRSLGPAGTLDPFFSVTSSSNQSGGTTQLASFNPTATINTVAPTTVRVEFLNAFFGDSATLRQLTVAVR